MNQQPSGLFYRLQRTGSLALAVLCVTVVLAAGCTDSATTTSSPAATSTLTPYSASSGSAYGLSFDPIVGVWRSPGAIYRFEITFDVNGKTQERYASVPNVCYNGTWISVGDNSYLVTRDSGDKTLWIHDLSANTLYKKQIPDIVYTLYQGAGNTAGQSTGATSAVLSGTGGAVVPFTATESGLWIFKMQYSGSGNFIVWLKDSRGKQLSLLANEIGTYSGTKPLTVDAGKYYLNVTANGPWTIQASLS